MKKSIFCFLVYLLSSLICYGENIHFKNINTNAGLSQITILSIYQDELGTFWFGSNEGLNRYNGNRIEIYRPTQDNKGLTRNEIENITGDRNGTVYLRSVSDLIRFDLNTEKFTCILEKGASTMFCNNDTLWIGHKNTLSYYLKSEGKIHTEATIDLDFGYGTSLIVNPEYIWMRNVNGVAKISRKDYKVIKEFHINNASTIFEDSKHNLWVGTLDNGIEVITPSYQRIHYSDKTILTNNTVRTIIEDNKGDIWVGTFNGLNHYISDKDVWTHHVHQEGIFYSLTHNSINSLFKDAQGNIWIGTYFGGVNYFNPETNTCRYYGYGKGHDSLLSFPFIGNMVEDKRGDLWICSEGGGLNKLDRESQTFKHYSYQAKNLKGTSHNNMKCIYYLEDTDCLYIGTHTGGIAVFDIKKETFRTLSPSYKGTNPHSGNIVNHIQRYGNKFAVLTQAGLFLLDPKTETFSPFSRSTRINKMLTRQYKFQTFLIDNSNKLWLSLNNGGLFTVDLTNETYHTYLNETDDSTSIGKFKIMSIIETRKGEIYLGTIGSGLYKYLPQTDKFCHYGLENQKLSSNYCYSLCESPNYDHILVLHSRNFSVFDTEKGNTKSSYNLYKMGYSQGSSIYFTKDNETFIGGINGMISFNEEKLYHSNNEYYIYFDRLWINNNQILPNDSTGIIKQPLPRVKEFNLSHKKNSFTLELCSSNYTIKEKAFYEYKLEGFSEKWIPLHSTLITYTNLSPGDYTLKVRELQGHHETAVDIHIIPPFYTTIYAYLLYIVGVLLVMFGIISTRSRHIKLQASLDYERKEKEKTEELNQSKLKFFTNVSHEYRTPLTLIIGQIEALLMQHKFTPTIYNRILHIYRNALHMRYLVTEILDFRKLDQGYLKLRLEYRDYIPFVKNIVFSFNEYASFKHITYQFNYPEEEIKVWFDPVQMQKVIYNLISNAFKYTSEGGKINILLRCTDSKVDVSIKDTGCGIPTEEIEKIFERFYQSDHASGKLSIGTGIGLELANEIMKLHHGDIKVQSEVGVGSEFTIELLRGNSHFSADELENASSILTDCNQSLVYNAINLINYPEIESEENDEEAKNDIKMKLLLVDDNEEMLTLLKDLFKDSYNLFFARNGKEALDIVYEVHPNLIISDIMMPVMSGKELCHKIKNNVELSHIPVILLTALGTEQQEMEGYMFGADAYITKPFNSRLLITRCNNIIKNRQALYKNFSKQENDTTEIVPNVNTKENEFVKKVTQLIKDNYENSEFDMNLLASMLNIGRSKLYTYMKETTGLTPNEFTLKVKLEEAYNLLKNSPDLNISDISYKLGFSSPRYFSKCFKDFYGTAPLNIRKKE